MALAWEHTAPDNMYASYSRNDSYGYNAKKHRASGALYISPLSPPESNIVHRYRGAFLRYSRSDSDGYNWHTCCRGL